MAYSFTIEPLRQKIEDSGRSYRSICSDAGIHHMRLYAMLKGEQRTIENVLAICNVLNFSPKRLFVAVQEEQKQ